MKHADNQDRDVRFAIACNGNKKGIHLRGREALRATEIGVRVDPVSFLSSYLSTKLGTPTNLTSILFSLQIFLDADKVENSRKIGFNMKFSLGCDDAPWVQHPDHLDLMYVTRHFLVHVDPKGLEPGAHSAYIKAYDVKNVRKLF